MSGFRLWLNDFVVGASNISSETGKVDNGNGTYSYTHDNLGVQACLLDLCDALMTKSGNGLGWELNTDLCPDGKPILLKDTINAYALFFRNDEIESDPDINYGGNTPGRNLMIVLPLTGYNSTHPSYINSESYLNKPFLRTHLCDYTSGSGYSSETLLLNDICFSLTYTLNDVWDTNNSIQDENFYPNNSSPIMFLASNYNSSKYYYSYPKNNVSLINYGTTDTSITSSTANANGPVPGSKCRYFILANEFGDIGIGASYKDKRPYMAFAGNFYNKKFDPNDNLPTAKGGYFWANHASDDPSVLWYYGSNATTTALYTSYDVYTKFQDFYIDGKWLNYYDKSASNATTNYRNMYIANPSLRKYTAQYKTAHQIITNMGFLDKEKLRAIDRTGASIGQTYNSKNWCFISLPYGNIDESYSPMRVYSSNDAAVDTYGVLIRWDGQYNGNKTFY